MHGFRWGALVAAGVCAAALPAYAQGTARSPWQLEIHAGGTLGGNADGGTPLGQFPVGNPIPTGMGTATSRAISTWYFGDGAQLLNQTNAALGASARITQLDPALTSALTDRERGAVFGFRLGRDLTRRFAAEFNFDYADSPLRLRDSAANAIQAANSSFITAWNGLLATGFTFNRNVTSTPTIVEGDGHEMTLTGALKVQLGGGGRLSPYVTAGGGAILLRGDAPSATLSGRYSFLFGNIAPVDERDEVTVRVEPKDTVAVGLVGGGIEYNLGRRHGLRADVRFHFSGSEIDTIVTATPAVQVGQPGVAVSTGTLPSVQFSNNPIFNRPSSLSGPAVTGLRTFEGSGIRVSTDITFGFFMRF